MPSIGPVGPASAVLLTAADETGAAVQINAGVYDWQIWGTWDGATAQLEVSPNGTNWGPLVGHVTSGPTTDQVYGVSKIGRSAGFARVVITGAGASTSLTSELRGVE
jgi:hypothetical protein